MTSLVKDGMVSVMCKYNSDFIIKYRDSNISQDEKDKFELHILNCEVCMNLLALDNEFIDFLKDDNCSASAKFSKIQVMSNIDLNKYSGRGKVMVKLSKWKSTSIKIAAILFIVSAVGLSFKLISPIRESFKAVALSILDKQNRLNDNLPTTIPLPTINVISEVIKTNDPDIKSAEAKEVVKNYFTAYAKMDVEAANEFCTDHWKDKLPFSLKSFKLISIDEDIDGRGRQGYLLGGRGKITFPNDVICFEVTYNIQFEKENLETEPSGEKKKWVNLIKETETSPWKIDEIGY